MTPDILAYDLEGEAEGIPLMLIHPPGRTGGSGKRPGCILAAACAP